MTSCATSASEFGFLNSLTVKVTVRDQFLKVWAMSNDSEPARRLTSHESGVGHFNLGELASAAMSKREDRDLAWPLSLHFGQDLAEH